jgi:hypothetical protein
VARWYFRQNDPCDEWPRHLVLEHVGLQACGCPREPVVCACPTSSGVHACLLSGSFGDKIAYNVGQQLYAHPGLGE